MEFEETDIKGATATWLALVNDPKAQNTVPSIYQTLSAVFQALKEPNGIASINAGLALVQADRANTHHSVAVLRTLSRRKNELPAWFGLRDEVYKALEKRASQGGASPDEVMLGLYDDDERGPKKLAPSAK